MTTLGEVRAQEDWAKVKATASTTRRRGSLYALVKQLVKGHNDVAANTGIRLRRLESEVLEPLSLNVNIRYHDDLIVALQQRVDLLTRALAKRGIVPEELFEDRPLADSCPYACDPDTGCPHCERHPELYCWRCDAAKDAA